MVTREEVPIRCGSIVLEGVLEVPDNTAMRLGGAVVCHPHPQFGGNMFNNVVRALRKAFLEQNLICLRFNFRGTGGSEGAYGGGIDEIEDVRAALDFAEGLDQLDPTKLVLAGYSFGCWVALHAAASDPRPSRLIGISPPVDEYDFSFLKEENRPKLLVAGDNDFVCSLPKFRQLLDEIPNPKVGKILPGTDHFHVGREEALISEVNSFLDIYPLDNKAE
ncbi:MAG: alpha/beta fold hydrolase [Desulfomonile tiedjei]|nr:alpha/beta fold hydrolase [Desulfomonile tiedjei]